jgi:hypothetical protein
MQRLGFSVRDAVLLYPSLVRLADLDLQAGVVGSPLPDQFFELVGYFHVIRCGAVL